MALTGCLTNRLANDGQPVEPNRFIIETPRPESPPTPGHAAAPADAPTVPASAPDPDADTADATTTPDPAPRPAPLTDAIPTDAMVGHINGHAVYAHQVLEPINDRLAALARRTQGDEFANQAARIIAERLRSIIMEKLIIGAAERDLFEHERLALGVMVQKHREELLRKHGMGSPAAAEANIQKNTGLSLAETLQRYRQEVLIRRYTFKTISPKLNVTRRDIERHYADHIDQYVKPERREVRLIVVSNEPARDRIAAALDEGQPFIKVAEQPDSLFASSAGQTFDEPITPDSLRSQAVADTAFQLKPGRHAGPIQDNGLYWFVFVEKIHPGANQPLKLVQTQIEEDLRKAQFDAATNDHRRELFENGSYTDPLTMAERLLEIAVRRHENP